MSATDQLSRITPYVSRLLQDEYVQDQIGDAIAGLRRSSRRAKGREASDALTDRRLQRQVSGAAGSLTAAVRALRKPPPPKRHLATRAVALAAAAGGAAWVWQSRASTPTAARTNR
jgi:hypothetical protein